MKVAGTLIALLLGAASSVGNAHAYATKSDKSEATTTTISSSLNPSIYGEQVTFTAAVTSNLGAPPDGEIVTFVKGSTELGTGTLSSGSATFTISTLSGGTSAVKAVYAGDSTFAGSTSKAVSQVVSKAATTTTLASSRNPSNVGQSVTFTASVAPEFSGTVSGGVAFYNGSTKLGTASLSGGIANYTTTKLPVGSDSITAMYNGSSSFTGSASGAESQTVGSGTFVDSTMIWDDITRYYEVFVPTALPANPPMVLMLHGTQYNGTAQDIISLNWGWQAVANQYGFILVKPASTYDPTSHQWNWNAYFLDGAFAYAEGCGAQDCPDDSGFLRQLIANLTAQYNVNPDMVYVAGFSSGAEMAERVGVDLSDVVAAISPASGQLVAAQGVVPPPLPFPTAPNPFPPISVQEWHGTLDTELPPCNYGRTSYSGVIFTLDTVDDTFNYWTGPNTNACTVFQTTQTLCSNGAPNNANDAPTPGMSGLTGNIATGCTNNVEVQFIWEPDIAHSFQQQNNTARWLFFASNPMPASRKR